MTASAPGTPTWLELTTDQPLKARNFYAELFGWTVEQEEMPGFGMIHQGQTLVGGFIDSTTFPNFAVDPVTAGGSSPVPNAWTVYLATEDLEASLAGADQAGGKDLTGVREVDGKGRFAIVQGPAGACLGLWEHRGGTGLEFPMTPGTPVWFEAMTKDFDATEDFCRRTVGWNPAPLGGDGADGGDSAEDTASRAEDAASDGDNAAGSGGFRYATHQVNGRPVAGMCDASAFLPAEVPSFWRVYFLVEETDAALRAVENLGGRVLDGPQDSPFGRVATVADPTGAVFQVVDGNRQ